MKRTRKTQILLLYSLLFYGIWSVWELWARAAVGAAVGNACLSRLIQDGVFKNLIWTLPAILLIRRFRGDVYLPLKDMFTARPPIRKSLPLFLGFTVYLLLGALITRGKLTVGDSFSCGGLIAVLFAGLSEETVFRGWLLNYTVNERRKWRPILLNALMFLLIHFPIWIAGGQFAEIFLSVNVLCLPVLSVIFSWVFLQSKSIWLPIALHSYWDLLILLFY